MEKFYSDSEKERIFVERTQREYQKCWAEYESLVAHEKMSEDELAAYNFQQRVEILSYAYENTAFYRNLYKKAGIHPNDVRSEDDWGKLPIVTKEMIRSHFEEFIAHGTIEKYGASFNTGGSTGIPLRIYRDKRGLWPGIQWRFMTWFADRHPGQLLAKRPSLGLDEAFIRRLDNYGDFASRQKGDSKFLPARRYYLDATNMSAERICAFNEDIANARLGYVHGYTGALAEYVGYNKQVGYTMKSTPIVAIGVATQMNAISRRVIEEYFGCPACNAYASREMGWMATECPNSCHDLHVQSDVCAIDIVDENGALIPKGKEGIVVVTSFLNRVMPLIRYRIGDKARYLDRRCDCGRPFPLIAPVSGRESDYLVGRNGRKVFELDAMFDKYPASTKGFQFRQHLPGAVTVVVAPEYSTPGAIDMISEMFSDICKSFGEGIDFKLELVDSIPHDGGKIRFIVYD